MSWILRKFISGNAAYLGFAPKGAKGEKRKMNSTRKNTKVTAAIAIIMMTTSILLITSLPANAQSIIPPVLQVPAGVTPTASLDTIAYMSLRPNPVGVNQVILVNVWLEPPTNYARYLMGLEVQITKPNGDKDTFGPMTTYQGDSTAWFEYTVDQVGTWKFKFVFPGNYWTNGTVPPGFMASGPQYLASCYYKPSSTKEVELVVQSEPVLPWPASPLPTDYWTRPVSPENREWTSILGDYPWIGYMKNPPANTNHYASNYKFTPYVQAPNTAHIVWKRQGAISGLMGGDYGLKLFGSGEGTYAGTPSIIFEGRCYQAITKVVNGSPTSVWQSYDLRTGEVYWEILPPTTTGMGMFGPTTVALVPSAISFVSGVEAVPGATQSQVGTGASLVAISGGYLIKYNPYTGAMTLNASISPLTSATIYSDPYALSVQTLGSGANAKYYLINWTIAGSATTLTSRIISNTSYAFSSIGTADYESMIAVTTQSLTPAGAGISTDVRIMAASLTTGKLLWNTTAGVGFGLFSGSTACADHGKYAVRFNDGYWLCWDLASGNKLWTSELSSWPWGIWGAYNVASAYGYLYYMQYDGIIAYDWDNGKIVWQYSCPNSPFETPFTNENGTTVSPFFTNAVIADGKVYSANGEHSPTSPLARGWKLHCIDAFTGEGIWNITGGGTPGAMADGYLTFDSRYDGYMYVFGKGKSATTVDASDQTIAKGDSVLVEGTVLDQSPAQPGTPCVSKESMMTYMEYLHMQKQIPSGYTVTGVPVMLLAFDENGTMFDLGTATSDASGRFAKAWTPENEGVYKITATFVGDDSYGSSWAETGVSVGPAPAVDNSQQQQQQVTVDNTPTYFAVSTIAIIIAISVATVLILRKRA